MATTKKTAKKKVSSTARKRPSKPRRRSTPSTAAAAPDDAAPKQRWYEHPLASPVVWTVIGGALAAIWAFGQGLYTNYAEEILWAPEPFAGDRVGILLARLENDPGNEYASRVRSALERQFPIGPDGSSSVEVSLYPQKLELPEQGRLSDNLVRASVEGRKWLTEQKADLLIWGRALPSAQMLELRILTREQQRRSPSAQPELYPIKIPTEFSEQIGGALAGMVAGAGANAWNQRGSYLSPARAQELHDWMSRLKKLKNEIPDSLDQETRTEIQTQIDTARVQMGAALLADGTDPRAGQIIDDVFTTSPTDELDGVWVSHPFLVAEILADMVSQFAVQVGQISEEYASTLLALINKATEKFEERNAKGEFEEKDYAYLSGMTHKLAGQVQALSGRSEEAKDSLARASEQLEIVLKELSGTPDELSRARVQGYLGEVQLIQASLHDTDEAEPLLKASAESFSAALSAIAPDLAPRDAARLRQMLATAELNQALWYVDAGALTRAIDNMEDFRLLLKANRRHVQTTNATIQLASLLFADAVYRSGVSSAKKSLALLDDLNPRTDAREASEQCAGMDGAQKAQCVEGFKIGAEQQIAAIELGRCQAHLAAGLRFDPDGETLSAEAQDRLARSGEACEASAEAMSEVGNIVGWAQAELARANGLQISGERTGNERQLQEALEIARAVQDRLGDIHIPELQAQTALIAAGASRDLGALTSNQALVQDAIGQEHAARRLYAGKEYAAQRLQADTELALSLVALAELQGTRDGLDEAIELLSNARDRYAAAGAKLAAEETARNLKKAEAVQAKLALN